MLDKHAADCDGPAAATGTTEYPLWFHSHYVESTVASAQHLLALHYSANQSRPRRTSKGELAVSAALTHTNIQTCSQLLTLRRTALQVGCLLNGAVEAYPQQPTSMLMATPVSPAASQKNGRVLTALWQLGRT
jgi:hypothetical protein